MNKFRWLSVLMKKTKRDWRVGIKVAAAIVERHGHELGLDKGQKAATAASMSGGWGKR